MHRRHILDHRIPCAELCDLPWLQGPHGPIDRRWSKCLNHSLSHPPIMPWMISRSLPMIESCSRSLADLLYPIPRDYREKLISVSNWISRRSINIAVKADASESSWKAQHNTVRTL